MPAAEPLGAAKAAGARPAPGGSVVTLRGLSHGYGAAPVIRGLDLRVEAGEFVSIVGQSGCGKSTLLRLIAGLDRPDAGRAELDGLPAPDATDRLRIMFQEPRLLPWASVAGNVAIGLRHGPDSEAVSAALEQVQLGEKAGVWPARLSGGQRQRVALARALVSHPRLLLLDEPLGALDALTRLAMQRLIGQMQRRACFTAILVTHDVTEAVSLSDRVIVLGDGGIRAQIAVPPAITPAQRAALESRTLAAIFGAPDAPLPG